MSIVVTVHVGEGIVLATDSALTVAGSIGNREPELLKVYDNARKLQQFRDWPVAIA